MFATQPSAPKPLNHTTIAPEKMSWPGGDLESATTMPVPDTAGAAAGNMWVNTMDVW